MRILGVDQDPVLLELGAEYFEDLGHRFEKCQSLFDAQTLLAQESFDAAFIDYHLAGGTGGRTLVQYVLKSLPKLRLVVVSGDHAPETEAAVKSLGVANFLAKPFRFRQLLNMLDAGTSAKGPRLTVYGEVEPVEIEALKQILFKDPANLEARWLLAFAFYRAGDYGDACHLLKEILRARPDNGLALYYLGACNYRFGVYEEAVLYWRRLIEIDQGGPLSKKAIEHLERAEIFNQG